MLRIIVIVCVFALTGCGSFYIEATGALLVSDSVGIDRDVEKKRITSTSVEMPEAGEIAAQVE